MTDRHVTVVKVPKPSEKDLHKARWAENLRNRADEIDPDDIFITIPAETLHNCPEGQDLVLQFTVEQAARIQSVRIEGSFPMYSTRYIPREK